MVGGGGELQYKVSGAGSVKGVPRKNRPRPCDVLIKGAKGHLLFFEKIDPGQGIAIIQSYDGAFLCDSLRCTKIAADDLQ